MPVKTALFLLAFLVACGGALYLPLIGALGYVAHYAIGPERQWWAGAIRDWGIRYSYMLALLTATGILLRHRMLHYGRPLLRWQEGLLLLFLGIVWVSTLMGEPTEGVYSIIDHPSVKMTKVVLFTLMLTHVVTTVKDLDRLLWVLIVTALILGLQAYDTPRSQFTRGRLDSVGGPDFAESNTLAAYLAAMLPLIGVQFLRSKWPGRLLCLASGVFTVNTIILTRSRGSLLGIAAGALAAVILAPKKHRAIVLAGVVVVTAGGYYLTDPGFIGRAGTITASEDERDRSAQGRLEIWEASLKMLSDHPFGVGAGNFYQAIGRYNTEYEGRDAHNTIVRCYGELGIPGCLVLLLIVGTALRTLLRLTKPVGGLPTEGRKHLMLIGYALAIGLVTLLACSMTMTLLYMEAWWWLFAIPVCIERAAENLQAEAKAPFLRAARRC